MRTAHATRSRDAYFWRYKEMEMPAGQPIVMVQANYFPQAPFRKAPPSVQDGGLKDDVQAQAAVVLLGVAPCLESAGDSHGQVSPPFVGRATAGY